MTNTPEHWIISSLSDVAAINMGQSPDSRSYNGEGSGFPFFQGKAEFGKLYPTVRKWCTEPTKIAEAGDILLSVRAPVGPTNLAPDQCCIGRGLAAIRAVKPFDQIYLLYYFRWIEPWLTQQGTGTTFAAISGDFIKTLDVPVAPLNEQKRIADKLDTLLTQVDACRERLDRVPQILKGFRQAVLAVSASGVLTEDWREKRKIKAGSLKMLSKVVTLKTGPFGSALHREDYVENGVPVINPMHINNGKITPSTGISVTPQKADGLAEFSLKKGDVIIARRGVMGRCAVVTEVEVDWLCGTGSMVLRSTKDLVPAYLQICLSSPEVVTMLERQSVGSTMTNLNQGILLGLEIIVPSISEQHEIVHRVETLFAFADRLETYYTAGRKQVDQLIPSLLDKAFRGELVPQDPNDEPVEELLARIRTSKTNELIKPKRSASGGKPKTMKITTETVKTTVQQMPQEHFSFEELRNFLPGDYESLKNAVFALLSESETLNLFFDPVTQSMRFKRSQP